MHEIMKVVSGIQTEIGALRTEVRKMTKTHSQKLSEEWIDKQDVMFILKISPRKLQSLRDRGLLPYSQIDGKFFYRTSDVEKLLENGYKWR
jgi:hypothetical protein